jgi:multidrug resistance protein
MSSSAAQFAITIFLIGYAIGQLPYGPLSNKIGRKPTLFIGLGISIVGSLVCGVSDTFWMLIGGRILTALGASVGLMLTYTIVSDVYNPEQARKKLAFVSLAFAIAPGAAVALGGVLTQFISWESTFFCQALYGVVLLLLSTRLPETSSSLSTEPYTLKLILDSYLRRCNNLKLVICSLIQGSCTSFVYVFAALAPFMVIHLLGKSPSVYGMLNLIPSAGMILGSVFSHFTSHILSAHRSILLGLSILLISTLTMGAIFVFGEFNLWTLFAPFFLMNIGITLAYINCPAIGTADAKNKPNAAAVLAFLNISTCVVTVFILQGIGSGNPILMPALFLALLGLAFPLYIKLEKMITSV